MGGLDTSITRSTLLAGLMAKKSAISALSALRNRTKEVTDSTPDLEYDSYEYSQSPLEGVDVSADASADSSVDPAVLDTISFVHESKVVSTGGAVVVGLQKNERIALKGMAQASVYKGAISIHGSILTPNDDPVLVYGLDGLSLPLIVALGTSTVTESSNPLEVPQPILDQHVVLVLRSYKEPVLQLLPRLVHPARRMWNVSGKETFELVIEHNGSLPVQSIFSTWKPIELAPNSTLMIIGSKSSGKSTFGQYLVNKWLNTNKEVLYLDLDPGQPEYSPPGMLSLHKISKRTFGPPFTKSFLFEPLLAYSLGYNSPRDQPLLYMQQARDLIHAFEDLRKDFTGPLIVNTPGWTRGLGINLIADIASELSPSFIVHVGALGTNQYEIPDCFDRSIPFTCIQSVLSTISESNGKGTEMTAPLLRTLSFMSFFHAPRSMQVHLTRIPPYVVPFESIAGVAILSPEGIKPNDVSLALNATIVAMVVLPEDLELPIVKTPEGIPWITDERLAYGKCVGYAIIQSITSDGLRILTPRPPTISNPQKRLVFVRGRLVLPVWEMWDATGIKEGPYLSKESSGITHVRRNIRRRG